MKTFLEREGIRHEMLQNVVSMEPIRIAVRQGDDGFLDVVNGTLAVIIEAQRLGIATRQAAAYAIAL